MKIVKKDYPFTVIIEGKKSKAGKDYISIGIGFTEKNPNATCDADKYQTKWINTIDERDLLKGASIFENAYQAFKAGTQAKQEQTAQQPAKTTLDDAMPF